MKKNSIIPPRTLTANSKKTFIHIQNNRATSPPFVIHNYDDRTDSDLDAEEIVDLNDDQSVFATAKFRPIPRQVKSFMLDEATENSD